MTVVNGWGLGGLTHVGVEAEEPKLEGQRCSGGCTTRHRRTTFSLTYLLQI